MSRSIARPAYDFFTAVPEAAERRPSAARRSRGGSRSAARRWAYARHETVEPVATWRSGLQQVVPAQLLQSRRGLTRLQIQAGQGGCRVRVEIMAWVQRQQAQQSLVIGRQMPVRQIERQLDGGVQTPLLVSFVEPVGVVGQGPAGEPGDVPGDQAESEREMTTAPRYPGQGPGIGTHRDALHRLGEELLGLLRAEDLHAQRGRVRQTGQAPAAGHQRQAAGAVGDQRPDLLLVGRVVQHHQHPQAGQPVAERPHPGGETVRELLDGHAQQAQETVEHRARVDRGLGRIGVEAAQVDEEDPVEAVLLGEQQPGVHGQAGLADPGHPRDRDDPLLGPHCPADPLQLLGPAGEPGHGPGQVVLRPAPARRRLAVTDHA